MTETQTESMPVKTAKSPVRKAIHATRVVASCALLGAVVGGAVFGSAPLMLGAIGVHEIGALIGAAVGVAANVKHLA